MGLRPGASERSQNVGQIQHDASAPRQNCVLAQAKRSFLQLRGHKTTSASSARVQTALGHFRPRSKSAQNCETVAKKFSLPRGMPQEGRHQFSLANRRSDWPSEAKHDGFLSILGEGRKMFSTARQGRFISLAAHLPPREPTSIFTRNLQVISALTLKNLSVFKHSGGLPGHTADRPGATAASTWPAAASTRGSVGLAAAAT